jgi:hypothetical protein
MGVDNHYRMETPAKLLYGSMAVVSTVAGLLSVYAATIGVGDWFWFGIGEYVWLSVLWLSLGFFWWYVVLGDPDFMSGTRD